MARRSKKNPLAQQSLPANLFEDASLVAETRKRYLSYALSVITSRALPDVRDGLKPVQRRILYTMGEELHLRPEARYRKSAAIVGEVMGKFHPHGDQAIYDALVRMAQPFTLCAPLVDGRGNFGSPDGDAAAAMRYTEAKLQPLAEELLSELRRQTVPLRPNYDGTRHEPAVLPARFPHLLVNGSQGIAVGMATAIPPHNLGEVIRAAIAVIDNPELPTAKILKIMHGPDFPTGGRLEATAEQLKAIYEQGQGSLKLYGTWHLERQPRGNDLWVVDSIPYSVERRSVVEKIAEVIVGKKLPAIVDVRDESTEETRVVCEIKQGTDPELIASYLYRHTPLAHGVSINLTMLVPQQETPDDPILQPDATRRQDQRKARTDDEADAGEDALPAEEVAVPKRLSLPAILRAFLRFRMTVVTRRLRCELRELRERIHLLEAFATVFDALDEALDIIRHAEGRKDAALKLQRRFDFDEPQTAAILELRLYKLARLEIKAIHKELKEKRLAAKRLDNLLSSSAKRWALIRGELNGIAARMPSPRRTRIVAQAQRADYHAEDFIADEDVMALVTTQGWLKRQQRIRDLSSTRMREGDAALAVVAGSTRSTVAFFSDLGACYTCRLVDIPASSGYGSPIQTLFKLRDGERIVAVLGFDERFAPGERSEDEETLGWVATRGGMTARFPLASFQEPSTRTGRRFARLAGSDRVLAVEAASSNAHVACASAKGRALLCRLDDISTLSGPGKGVTLMRLEPSDHLVAAKILRRVSEGLTLVNSRGTELRISARSHTLVQRGGKGHPLIKRGSIEGPLPLPPELPEFPHEQS